MTYILPSIEKFPYAGLGLLVLIVANVVILFVWKLFLIVRRKVRVVVGGLGGDLENQNGNNQVQIHVPAIDDNDWECPICMTSKENKIYTSCNHTFCEDCILGENPPGLWRTTFLPNKCNCPLCRQEVTTIFPYNRPVSAAIALYNGGVGGNPVDNREGGACTITSYFISLRNLIYESPLLFRSFISFLSNVERGSIKGIIYALYFSWKLIRYSIAIFGCVTYILLPGDFFDERKYGYLGWLDDGLVFYILLLIVLMAYRATVLTVYQHDH